MVAKAKSGRRSTAKSGSRSAATTAGKSKAASARGSKPSMVEGTQILRLNFDEPGGDDDDKLKEVSWEEFFQVFDDSDLSFLYSEQTAKGQTSRFFKFVRKE